MPDIDLGTVIRCLATLCTRYAIDSRAQSILIDSPQRVFARQRRCSKEKRERSDKTEGKWQREERRRLARGTRETRIKRFPFVTGIITGSGGGGRDRYSGGSASALSCGGEKLREDKQGRMLDGKTGIRREKEEDTKSADNVSRGAIPSRQSLLELVSSKCMSRHTPTHHYYHQQQQVSTTFDGHGARCPNPPVRRIAKLWPNLYRGYTGWAYD